MINAYQMHPDTWIRLTSSGNNFKKLLEVLFFPMRVVLDETLPLNHIILLSN